LSSFNERIQGGPNGAFIEKHNLNQQSHPINWMNALLPMVLAYNLEDPQWANIIGDEETKFALSYWTIYSNLKAVRAIQEKMVIYLQISSNHLTMLIL